MTLAERFPFLFNNYARDEQGRPMDDPANQGHLKVTSARTPTNAEVLNALLGGTLPEGTAAHVASDFAAFVIANQKTASLTAPPTGVLAAPKESENAHS